MHDVNKAFIVIVLIIFSYAAGRYTIIDNTIQVSDDERWRDINNLTQREAFCKYNGFDASSVGDPIGVKTENGLTGDYAPDPFHNIICIKKVEEKTTFNYNYYKKWLLSLQLTK